MQKYIVRFATANVKNRRRKKSDKIQSFGENSPSRWNHTSWHRAQWLRHHFHRKISLYCHYWMPNRKYCYNDDFSSIVALKCQPLILQVSIKALVDRHHLCRSQKEDREGENEQKETMIMQNQKKKKKEEGYNREELGETSASIFVIVIPETSSSPSLENSMALTQPKCDTKFVRYKFFATAKRSRNNFGRKLWTLLPNWRLIKCDTEFESLNFARAIVVKCGGSFFLFFLFCLFRFTPYTLIFIWVFFCIYSRVVHS